MSDQIETLRKLQSIDGTLFRLRREQQQKPLELEQAKQRTEEQQANAQAVEARLKALQLQHKEQEIELSTRETGIKKLQTQLFQVKTNKEYAAIQHEIEQAKADTSLLEEEIITLLEGIDQASKERTTELAHVTQRQQELQQEEARVGRELETIRAQISELDAQRKAVLPQVPPDTLSVYERILSSREGLAIVPLIEDSCSGCHMVQPPQVVSEASLQARLVTCENCNRILYIEDHQAPSPSAGRS